MFIAATVPTEQGRPNELLRQAGEVSPHPSGEDGAGRGPAEPPKGSLERLTAMFGRPKPRPRRPRPEVSRDDRAG